jgi:hypothetical protein
MNFTDFSGQRPIVAKCQQLFRDSARSNVGRTLCCLELLGLASTSDTTGEPTVRDNLFVVRDVRQVGVGLCKLQA